MKRTKRIYVAGITCCFFMSELFAGGLLTNINQSVHFLRNPAIGASTGIEAAYTNPAGLSFLENDGLTFSINNQSAFQTRTITATFAPFAANGGSETKEYVGKAKALFIPSLMAAYKLDKWVFSGNFSIIGGGGTAVFDKGLPSFESQVAMLPPMANMMLQGMGMPADYNISQYSLDQHLEGSQVIFGIQLGASYKITDYLSAYLGGRANIFRNGYKGYLKDIRINPNIPPMGLSGENMIPAKDFVEGLAASGLIPQEMAGALLEQVSDKEVDCKQSGSGIAPILGLDFKYDKLNVGVKYEFKTGITLKNETKINTTGVTNFDNAVKTSNDIPALFTVGASYQVLPDLTVSAGYHHFFDSDAEMVDNKQKNINGGINEYLLGAEWRINDMFLISAGGLITRTGVTNDYQSDLDFFIHNYSFGFGGAVDVTENIRINLGCLLTGYQDWPKVSSNYSKTEMPGTDLFSRASKAFGIGADFRF